MVDWGKPHSEEFIEGHIDCEGCHTIRTICQYQKLSDAFIRKYADKLYLLNICKYQKLSENLVEEALVKYLDKAQWFYIGCYQHLSESFIKRHIDKFGRRTISEYQKLSSGFRKEQGIPISKNNWLYKRAVFKKKFVRNTGLYECHKDYFIAYKAIRKDRYSILNFQYKYEKGGIYETHADYTDAENGSGFSAGTKEFAKEYANEAEAIACIIVRVKIYYKDVARVVHNGDKIRACKIEVLD